MAQQPGHASVRPQPLPARPLLRPERQDAGRHGQEPVQVEGTALISAHPGERGLMVGRRRIAQAPGQELGAREAEVVPEIRTGG